MKKLKNFVILLFSMLSLILPSIAMAQEPVPHHKELYAMDSGRHVNSAAESLVAFREVVRFPGVPWLQLHFSGYNLGVRSYITITSLQDKGQQRLDAKSLPQWQNSSAYFNGDTVEVVLHVAPGEQGIFFRIKEVTVGEWMGKVKAVSPEDIPPLPESQCGANDDRVATTDPGVGCIMPIGCTGWIVSNGANLTAGHCINANTQLLEFNVPASQPDGTPVNPPPQDQYPIEPIANIDFFDDGLNNHGNDWAVFETFPNGNTNRLAIHIQGTFYRMSRDYNPTTVRVTGYGVDFVPAGLGGGPFYCPNCNSDSQTLQTHLGTYLGETPQGPADVFIEYTVDTEGSNSGSPVINIANNVAIGIHTNAGCNPPSNGNIGTSFENDNLENAIQNFPGANVRYVDNGHPIGLEDGTVFRPYNTMLEAVNAAPLQGVISIVAGSYIETMTIEKPLTLQAPVGVVTIGN